MIGHLLFFIWYLIVRAIAKGYKNMNKLDKISIIKSIGLDFINIDKYVFLILNGNIRNAIVKII